MMALIVSLLILAGTCEISWAQISANPSQHDGSELLPQAKLRLQAKNGIEGSYLVVFNKNDLLGSSSSGESLANWAPILADRLQTWQKQTWGSSSSDGSGGNNNHETAQILYTYQHALIGFTLSPVSNPLLQTILQDESVAWVEQDQVVTIDQLPQNKTQTTFTWGIDRIDQRKLPINLRYNYRYTGKGVNIYVIDTGIYTKHWDFTGPLGQGPSRASCGTDLNRLPIDNCHDRNGHGTHVAGTAAGRLHGIAKDATVIAVQSFSKFGRGSSSAIAAGMDYVVSQRQALPNTPFVVNMSFGAYYSDTIDAAAKAMIAARAVSVAAAGNAYRDDACYYSPASTPDVITVASFDNGDYTSFFSNIGSCIDIFAPGEDIPSAWTQAPWATNALSGTSMSTPHIVGVAALYLEAHPDWTPAKVWEAMAADATMDKVLSVPTGTVNRMVFTGLIA